MARRKSKRGRPPTLRKPRTLVVRLDGAALDALEELADDAEASLSDYVRGLVSRHLRAKGCWTLPRDPPTRTSSSK